MLFRHDCKYLANWSFGACFSDFFASTAKMSESSATQKGPDEIRPPWKLIELMLKESREMSVDFLTPQLETISPTGTSNCKTDIFF